MYKINFYPEYTAVRRAGRLRNFRLVVALCLVGLPLLLGGVLGMSYLNLGHEQDWLETRIPRLSEDLRAETRPTLELDVVQQLVAVRRERVDWSPKLASVSTHLDSLLLLAEVGGRIPVRRTPGYFDVGGTLLGSDTDLQPIYDFIERLRQDPRLARDFPSVSLEAFRGGSQCRFDLICRRGGKE